MLTPTHAESPDASLRPLVQSHDTEVERFPPLPSVRGYRGALASTPNRRRAYHIAQPTASRLCRDSATVTFRVRLQLRVRLRLRVRCISRPSTTPHPLHFASVYDSASVTFRVRSRYRVRLRNFPLRYPTCPSPRHQALRARLYSRFIILLSLLVICLSSLNKFIISLSIIESLLRSPDHLRTPHKTRPTAFGKRRVVSKLSLMETNWVHVNVFQNERDWSKWRNDAK